MPLPFEQFEGNGVLGFLNSSPENKINGGGQDLCYVVGVNNGGFLEPTSVLDSFRSPSPFLSSSTTTLSSSHGGGTSGGAATAAFSGADVKLGFENLDGEQSILRLMAGDVVNPGSCFLGFDPSFGSDPNPNPNPNPLFGYGFPFHEEEKFQVTMDPDPGSIGSDPPTKRLYSGQCGSQQPDFHHPFSDPGNVSHDPFLTPLKLAGNEQSTLIIDQSTLIINQLFNAATELNGTSNGGDNNNNPILAQEILARLNHNLNGNNPNTPFEKAALNIIEALHTLLQHSSLSPHPQTLILKIAAHKAFSETSPFTQFINFTANQTILESIEGFDRIHIVDFDIGLGTQWSSLIQELAGGRRNKSVKITAFASPSTLSEEFELRFTEDNLRNFAKETGISLEIELLNMEILLTPTYWPHSLLRSSTDKEAIAVNLPISSIVSGYLPLILRFLKQISPNVVVCSDRSCDIDAPFPNVVIHALHYYTSLLESIGNPIQEAVTSIERFYVQPSILKLLTNRMERSPPWRSLFQQCGFSPVGMSQTAETQAEYLLQRNPMRGFHLEKKQSLSSSSLVLCWERKELVTVSAWKC